MSGWPSVPLARIVKPIERAEVPVVGNSYRQVGVKLWGVGAYERATIDGGGTRYKTLSRVEANDIIVNKIWARNGSVAVVPAHLAGCYVSGEFPTFTPIPDKLDPRWFHWITKTRFFWDQCDAKSRGTSGKNRIRPDRFLEIEIPLPPLPEQRRIVARIEELATKINEAPALRRVGAKETEAMLNAMFRRRFLALSAYPATALGELTSHVVDGPHVTPSYLSNGSGGIPLLQ
jgi:type I restriction enzyme S subunit